MNRTDITTLYSAQAAIKAESLLDQKNSWFSLSLATLTSSLLFHDTLYVAKPPTSKEEGKKPPGEIADYFFNKNIVVELEEPSEVAKQNGVKATLDWFNSHKKYFDTLLKDSKFWQQPALHEWWKWHEENELTMHGKRLGGLAGQEFDNLVRGLGAREPEEIFTLDVLIRGYYYYILNKGNIWLHPIRANYMPGSTEEENVFTPDFYPWAVCIILGVLEEKTSSKKPEKRIGEWHRLVNHMRKYASDEKTTNNTDILFNVAKDLGIAKADQIADIGKKILDLVPIAVGAYLGISMLSTDPATVPVTKKILPYGVAFLSKVFSIGGKALGKRLDVRSVKKLENKGRRVLLLTKSKTTDKS